MEGIIPEEAGRYRKMGDVQPTHRLRTTSHSPASDYAFDRDRGSDRRLDFLDSSFRNTGPVRSI